MILSWDIFSTKVDLIDLLNFLSYTKKEHNPYYLLYTSGKRALVVLNHNQKLVFSFTDNPKMKGGAIDLLLYYVSKSANENLSECDKVNLIIEKYIQHIGGVDALSISNELLASEDDFNLFNTLFLAFGNRYLSDFNADLALTDALNQNNIYESPLFKNKVFAIDNTVVFPLVNQSNHTVGMQCLNNNELITLPYSDTNSSIWFSNITNKTDYIFVFNTPNEAISFYLKFKEQNAIYIALNMINYSNTQLLFNIQKTAKTKNMIFCFSQSGKGYINDLILFSNLKNQALRVDIKSNHLEINFKFDDQNRLSKFYKLIQNYNENFKKQYTDCNTTTNAKIIQNNSILVMNNSNVANELIVRLPLSLSPLKVFVWSYLKHFVKPNYKETIDILKPNVDTWNAQLNLNSKNNDMKTFKIAI